MDQNNIQPIESQTPGAAIGSFIVIAILIAGAVYVLGGEFVKKTVPENQTATTTDPI